MIITIIVIMIVNVGIIMIIMMVIIMMIVNIGIIMMTIMIIVVMKVNNTVNIAIIIIITWIFPTTPVESILDATLTAFPQMSYWGFFAPEIRMIKYDKDDKGDQAYM